MTIPYHNMKTIGVQTPAHIIYRKHTWGVNRTNPLITHETITSSFKSEKAVLGLFPLDIRLLPSETGNIATFSYLRILHFFPFLGFPTSQRSMQPQLMRWNHFIVRRWFQTIETIKNPANFGMLQARNCQNSPLINGWWVGSSAVQNSTNAGEGRP